MFRRLSLRTLLASIALVAAPACLAGAAHADERDRGGRHGGQNDNHRGGGWDRGHDRGHDRNRDKGRDWGRNDRHYDNDRHRGGDLSLSFSFGRPYGYAAPYYPAPVYPAPVYRAPPVAYNDYGSHSGYGLRPYDCRDDRRWDYWRGRPAEIIVQLCANAYGDIYVVEGSQRFLRYQY